MSRSGRWALDRLAQLAAESWGPDTPCTVRSVLLDGTGDIRDLIPDISACVEDISADFGWIAPKGPDE